MKTLLRFFTIAMALALLVCCCSFAMDTDTLSPRTTNSFTYNGLWGDATLNVGQTSSSATTSYGYGPHMLRTELNSRAVYAGNPVDYPDTVSNSAYSVTASVSYPYAVYVFAQSWHYVNDTYVQSCTYTLH